MMFWVSEFREKLRFEIPSVKVEKWLDKDFNDRELIVLNARLIVHPISLIHEFDAESAIKLQEKYAQMGIHLIHLWEDILSEQTKLVWSRIKTNLGLNERIYARNTLVQQSSTEEAQSFFKENHQLEFIKQPYHYALRYEGEVLAMASFGRKIIMPNKGEQYKSVELSRFASKIGYQIPGAMSKLIQAFLKDHPVQDIMSVADRDWSLGCSYLKLGFSLSSISPAQIIYFHVPSQKRYFEHRLPLEIQNLIHKSGDNLNLEDLKSKGYLRIFNTGNYKFHYAL